MKIILIYTAGWLGMVAIAIFNGATREKLYGPLMRELYAHQLSTALAIVLFGIYIWVLTGIWQIESSVQALLIGGLWLIMTILFEFVAGHYLFGHSWEKLFHDYNLRQGRVWVLVLIWVSIAPYLVFWIRTTWRSIHVSQ
jgi:hypothetical protein